MSSNQVKSEQLGLPFGTAMHRLRKNILFKYVAKAGDDLCFRCGSRIESVEDLSIEHKDYWLHVSPELFWDLDNIAFSHLDCNKVHRPELSAAATRARHESLRADRSDRGVAWCSGCGGEVAVDRFTRNRYNANGLQGDCKDCQKRRKSRNLT